MLISTNIRIQISLNALEKKKCSLSATDCDQELDWESITFHQNQVHLQRTLMLTSPEGTDPSIPSWLGPGFEACPWKSLPHLSLLFFLVSSLKRQEMELRGSGFSQGPEFNPQDSSTPPMELNQQSEYEISTESKMQI